MANLNPDVEHIPQDGKILIKTDKIEDKEKTFDIRLCTFPTVFGEKLVMRILDQANVEYALKGGLSYVGFEGDDLKKMESILSRAYGLIIFAGPGGSGKTTSAYASLAHLVRKCKGACNILSLEHPVEYILDGINQTQVNPDGEFTYSRALRSAMRQDPDIIFVSDIPDQATAQMVTQAALTGHLILTQLPASDAAHAIHLFIEKGVEPYLVSMILEGVVAQRLARKICPECKEEIPVNLNLLNRLKDSVDDFGQITHFYKGKSCNQCRGSGYRGRTAIYQVISRDEQLLEFITRKPTPQELREEIQRLGYPSLKKAAVQKAIEGVITLEEALRVTTWT